MHILHGALPVRHVPVRVTRVAVIAHRYTYSNGLDFAILLLGKLNSLKILDLLNIVGHYTSQSFNWGKCQFVIMSK